MKRWTTVCSWIVLLSVFSSVEARASSMIHVSDQFLTDWSGEVTVVISLWRTAPSSNPSGTAALPPGYVLVGGGAWADYSGYGALLTSSFPDSGLTTWHAESKDHSYPDPHVLYIQAVGLKLEGLSEQDLRHWVRVAPRTTASGAHHPQEWVTSPGGRQLIGGGTEINWSGYGNLMTRSRPNGNTWAGAGKDHSSPSPATIKVFAIGMTTDIPGFGELEIQTISASSAVGPYPQHLSVSNTSGWVTTCAGGEATWNGYGRMLSGLKIVDGGVEVHSKDHSLPDGGTMSAFLIEIRKKP